MFDVKAHAIVRDGKLYIKAERPSQVNGSFSLDVDVIGNTLVVFITLAKPRPDSVAGQTSGGGIGPKLDTAVNIPEGVTRIIVNTGPVADITL